MAANESTMYRTASAIGRFLIGLVVLTVLLGIGYSFWPKIKAAYQSAPIQTQQLEPTKAPAIDISELDRLKAQNAAMQAQLDAARAAQQSTIVQQVPAGEAPQPITISAPPAPAVDQPAGDPQPDPAPRPIVIVHQTSADGAHQTVTGSGACAVSTRVARRCGDK